MTELGTQATGNSGSMDLERKNSICLTAAFRREYPGTCGALLPVVPDRVVPDGIPALGDGLGVVQLNEAAGQSSPGSSSRPSRVRRRCRLFSFLRLSRSAARLLSAAMGDAHVRSSDALVGIARMFAGALRSPCSALSMPPTADDSSTSLRHTSLKPPPRGAPPHRPACGSADRVRACPDLRKLRSLPATQGTVPRRGTTQWPGKRCDRPVERRLIAWAAPQNPAYCCYHLPPPHPR
eukprot:scaffold50807_cov28-Tisochrysis_lutea.AAC.2